MGISNFEKIYKDGVIKDYEKELVADGICKSFIPASFIREEDRVKVIYNYDGYVRLSSLELDTFEILEVIESIIRKAMDAADLLVDYNRISFDAGTVFYSRENRDVRMAFVIAEEDVSFKERLISFIHELKAEEGTEKTVLDRLIRSISRENRRFSDVLQRIDKLKFELRKIG